MDDFMRIEVEGMIEYRIKDALSPILEACDLFKTVKNLNLTSEELVRTIAINFRILASENARLKHAFYETQLSLRNAIQMDLLTEGYENPGKAGREEKT